MYAGRQEQTANHCNVGDSARQLQAKGRFPFQSLLKEKIAFYEMEEEGNEKVMLLFAIFALIKTSKNKARVECIFFFQLNWKNKTKNSPDHPINFILPAHVP